MLEAIRGFGQGLLFGREDAARLSQDDATHFAFLTGHGRLRLERFLGQGNPVALFLLEADNFVVFRDIYGSLIADRINSAMLDEAQALADELLRGCHVRFVESIEPGRVVVLCGEDEWDRDALEDVALAFRLKVRSRIKQEALNLTGQSLNVQSGFGLLDGGDKDLEASVYRALSDARRVAAGTLDSTKLALLTEFRDVLDRQLIRAVYQPIVSLSSGNILSWEALTRGPSGSNFRSPSVLFDFAEEVEQVFALEKACRERAIRDVGPLGQGRKLFLNVHPRTLVDPQFSPGQTVHLLREYGLEPVDVVLEITERHSIKDFSLFHRTLEHYRSQGFRIAVDDVGTGYSGLWSIAQLRPEYLKVDMSLVRDVDADPVRRALLETLVTFSRNIGCQLIAEGVETASELNTLMRLGVHYGQGYFLARPAYPKPDLTPEVLGNFSRVGHREEASRRSSPIGSLALTVPTVPRGATVSEIRQMFGDTSQPLSSVVVVDDKERPLGLVMSHHLDHALSTQYGLSLYMNRAVELIMDPAPLYAESSAPMENVAREAMQRPKANIFDHVVVTRGETLVGVVTVQAMLDALATVQVEMAKGANPLTGLPGNVVIEAEMERRIAARESFSIVYADLDNFKAYNDVYGFRNGDDILLLVARLLRWAVNRHGDGGTDFVGHVGGDDFVVMCTSARAERIAKAVTRCFGRLVRKHYSPQDRERGTVRARGRDGVVAEFPLVSVSLAIVDCRGEGEMGALSRHAAEMKHYAKTLPGNVWVRDRRRITAREGEADAKSSSAPGCCQLETCAEDAPK